MTPPVQSRILVVDDEELMRRVLEARLLAMGHAVILAANGEDGLDKAAREAPDLILLDVMMPYLDGFATARRLKELPATRHIPIVMVTALGDVQDRVRALEAGADDFLTKPVDSAELKARVQSLLQVKAYHDHLRRHQEELEAEIAQRTDALRQALRQVQAATLDTIHRLARAAEYKDEDTGAHLQRVSHYARIVARQMGQPAGFIELLLYAVPMHDIGKIGIPDRILLKRGALDPDEWRIMQTHTEIGARLLSGSDSALLQMAERVAASHHEKWDGTGYPRGLRQEAIPLAGRIAALADVFDALCSRRPYKEPFPVERALAIIRAEAGKHFDPVVAEAFLAVPAAILETQRQFQDER